MKRYLFIVSILTVMLVNTSISSMAEDKNDYTFALRTNLVHWAALAPNIGAEWRATPRLGFVMNGSWTSWSWLHHDRRYAWWEASPEVRYYILGRENRGYVGTMYHTGEVNLKFDETGRQGDYYGCGITGGYIQQIMPSLSLDLHFSIGYTRFNYDKYHVTGETRVYQQSDHTNYWGLNQLGATLVWILGK